MTSVNSQRDMRVRFNTDRINWYRTAEIKLQRLWFITAPLANRGAPVAVRNFKSYTHDIII